MKEKHKEHFETSEGIEDKRSPKCKNSEMEPWQNFHFSTNKINIANSKLMGQRFDNDKDDDIMRHQMQKLAYKCLANPLVANWWDTFLP